MLYAEVGRNYAAERSGDNYNNAEELNAEGQYRLIIYAGV
jgi:hypothetical protein